MRRFDISFVAIIIWMILCFTVMAKDKARAEYIIPEHKIKPNFSLAIIKCTPSSLTRNQCTANQYPSMPKLT